MKPSVKSFIANAVSRSMFGLFGGYFTNTKHQNYYNDYGYPESLTFENYYQMYDRFGIANAIVKRPVERVWLDYPSLQEIQPEDRNGKPETQLEELVRRKFEDLQFWTRLKEADEYSRVGDYSGIIFRFADNKLFHEPAGRVPGGLDGLVEVIPVFEGQLRVSAWDTDMKSPTYGKPKMYNFNEAEIPQEGMNDYKFRAFEVHPSRVHIWSKTGSVHHESCLKAPFNDLVTMEKIIGAGGEGFWKNAKDSLILNMDKDASPERLAAMLGVDTTEEIGDALDEVVKDWQEGFDQVLALQGMDSKFRNVSLPDPEKFFLNALNSACAAANIPAKVLIGSQSGERASTEDSKEWNQTCQARRVNYVKPNVHRIIRHFELVGILPNRDWCIDWTDLTESSLEEKITRAVQMADVNNKLMGTGERVFTGDEIREVIGYEPLTEDSGFEDVEPEDEEEIE